MVTNVNFPAPLQVLALLGTAFVIVICGAAAMYGRLTRRSWTKPVLAIIGIVVGLYVISLLSFSLASHERVLKIGEEKHFCEIDCHIAYAVLGVSMSDVAGDAKLWRVMLRTRFDEATISAKRPKEASLTPNPRKILLVDEKGTEYLVAGISPGDSHRFGDALKPGEAYVNELEFRVPVQLREGKLLVISTGGPEAILIGGESSPLHQRTYFAISPDALGK